MRTKVKSLVVAAMMPLAALSDVVDKTFARAFRIARLRRAGVQVSDSVVLLGPLRASGGGQVQLGERLLSYGDTVIETISGASLTVGDDVVLARGIQLTAHDDLTIGDRTMIGEYASIRTSKHAHGAGVQPRFSTDSSDPVAIGDDVWIGRGVIVMPGIMIGDGAVVGANAVVTRDVAAGGVVAGVPAKPIPPSSDSSN